MYQFSGKQPLEYENKTKLYLTRKSSAQPDNQLLDLIDYLSERYKKMNIQTRKQYFQWRNITQANLIAIIPAGGTHKCNEPVLFIDHIDTAFEADTFDNTSQRQTTQGADDNVSGLLALLHSVAVLKETQKEACRDIWLVHVTGEEYPAASLGIVYFLQQLFVEKQPIYTAVIVDMISHRVNRSDSIIQINPGDSTKSMLLAELALNYVYPKIKSNLILKNLQPVIRRWEDPYSYLYNTDGVRFVQYGFTCILFNEHINYQENFERFGYHDTLDTVDLIDFEYGQTVSQYAIATVAMFANADCPSLAYRNTINSLLLFVFLLLFTLK
jgi:Zn-dependent M28 family amino/carboxypeptidase